MQRKIPTWSAGQGIQNVSWIGLLVPFKWDLHTWSLLLLSPTMSRVPGGTSLYVYLPIYWSFGGAQSILACIQTVWNTFWNMWLATVILATNIPKLPASWAPSMSCPKQRNSAPILGKWQCARKPHHDTMSLMVLNGKPWLFEHDFLKFSLQSLKLCWPTNTGRWVNDRQFCWVASTTMKN